MRRTRLPESRAARTTVSFTASQRQTHGPQGFRDSLREFSKTRAGLVETLSAQDAVGWSRRATFTGTTLGRDATVLSYAKRIVDHELGHLDQLRRTLGDIPLRLIK